MQNTSKLMSIEFRDSNRPRLNVSIDDLTISFVNRTVYILAHNDPKTKKFVHTVEIPFDEIEEIY